jgi:hypothetical protein
MNAQYDVPFYANTADNTHCFQAALKMVLKFFHPHQDYSFEELEKITAKKDGGWTWPIAAMMWLSKNEFDVRDIELFDYEEFAANGKEYLREKFGDEIAEAQDKFTDLVQEQNLSKELAKYVGVKMEIPTVKDIFAFLDVGYLLICNINSSTLKGVDSYNPHSVVVTGYSDERLFLHNPGLPAQENQDVSVSDFEKAWAYPDESAKNILAVRLR